MKKIAALALLAMLQSACTKSVGVFSLPANSGPVADQAYFNMTYGNGSTVQFQDIYTARSGDTLFIGAELGYVAGVKTTKGFLIWLILSDVHDSSYAFGSRSSELAIYDEVGNVIGISNGLNIRFQDDRDGNSSGQMYANLLTLLPPPAPPTASGTFGNIYLPATGQ